MDLRTLFALGAAKEILDRIDETLTEREARKIAEDPEYLEKMRIKAEQQEQKWTERAEKIANGFENWAQNLEHKHENMKIEKREAYEKAFQEYKKQFALEYIYKRRDGRWLEYSEILDDHGNLKYIIKGKIILNRKRIEILDQNFEILAYSEEQQYLNSSYNKDIVSDIIYVSEIRSEFTYNKSERHLMPYKWRIEEAGITNKIISIYNANEERIFATLPSMTKEYTSLFVKSKELELHCILIYLITSTTSYNFTPAYSRYLETQTSG